MLLCKVRSPDLLSSGKSDRVTVEQGDVTKRMESSSYQKNEEDPACTV